MIPRYTRPEMAAIWSPENKFRLWYLIEAHAAEVMGEHAIVPADVADAVWSVRQKFEDRDIDVARIDSIEAETKHDVIAFLTYLSELVGPKARFVHQGMTSSDVLDTALALQMTEAADLLLAGMDRLLKALETRAVEHKNTVTVGRSHGIHAEPTTFGLKLLRHYAALKRGRARLVAAREEIATCQISGPVGTFSSLPMSVEEQVAERLGLVAEPVSTQVIPRDRHAAYFTALGLIASSIEDLATEIRHLQRTEVREAEEFFSKGQKGSSAMPHKRNPVLTENLTGLARLVRSAVTPALENVTLWHERDISHSSVERGIGPDATVTLDFAIHRAAGMIEKLVVYPERMQSNMDSLGGLVHSQAVLLKLTQSGVSREDSYRLVQRNAMDTWHNFENDGTTFAERLKADDEVMASLSAEEVDACFDLTRHMSSVDAIFERSL